MKNNCYDPYFSLRQKYKCIGISNSPANASNENKFNRFFGEIPFINEEEKNIRDILIRESVKCDYILEAYKCLNKKCSRLEELVKNIHYSCNNIVKENNMFLKNVIISLKVCII